MHCRNAVGMMWGLVFVHTLIKPDLKGFSHLLESAPLAVKLNPALSENMPSPPDRLQCPFDGQPFSLLLRVCRVRPVGSIGTYNKVQYFLFVCLGKHSVRGLEQTTSVVDAMGQHNQPSFTMGQFYITVFCLHIYIQGMTSLTVLTGLIQTSSIYLLV